MRIQHKDLNRLTLEVHENVTSKYNLENDGLPITVLSNLVPELSFWGAGMAQWWEHALASHRCGPGSIPRLGVTCGLSLLVLYSAPRGFLRVLRFPLPQNLTWFVLIVNFTLHCPQLVLQR